MQKFKLISIMLILLFFSLISFADTFIGNGGNIADLHLNVTSRHVRETLEDIRRTEEDLICTCPEEFYSHPLCETLKTFSEEEIRFCGAVLKANLNQLINLLKPDSGVQFNWVSEPMEVIENGRERLVDGVAQRANKTINLDDTKFKSSVASEKIFLLTHELLHLTKYDNIPLSDQGEIGPFKGENGGRHLLNSIAAYTGLQAFERGVIYKYHDMLERSHPARKFWIGISSKSITMKPNGFSHLNNTYLGGSDFTLRYQPNAFSFQFKHSNLSESKTEYQTLQIKQGLDSYALGIGYRFFLTENVFSPWSLNYFLIGLNYHSAIQKIELKDNYQQINDETLNNFVELEASYYISFFRNFWINLSGGFMSGNDFEFKSTGQKYSYPNAFSTIGVSYGF